VIITLVRTLNEERNIASFCQGYSFSDLILVADGGSTDRTKEIAAGFDNVQVRDFEQRIGENGTIRNPEPAHINFLINWALEVGASWIILDDCDCHPNSILKAKARDFFRYAWTEDKDGILLLRLYMWEGEQYLPKVNEAGASLWAWQPDRVDCRMSEESTTLFDTVMPGPNRDRCLVLDPPYVCLHFWEPQEKAARYEAWGKPQAPIENGIYWPPAPLPEWAR
jgi:glycosyltransferase involved in cell wall biosynthesis